LTGSVMKVEHGDFWDHVLAFINGAHEECSKMYAASKLDEFEKEWLDPIAGLSGRSWFDDAKPIAKKIATASIRSQIANRIEYYHFAETLLSIR
jgi:hypothetical protein